MKTVTLPDGAEIPALGQGTWCMGDDPDWRADEIEALREGIRRGLTLLDTAEMYGNGRSERLVGEAIADCRDDVFLVSMVLPSHAGKAQLIKACENSLDRLGTDHLDMYLLHWSGNAPFAETISGFEQLKADGKIVRYGVSNLDLDAMQAFVDAPGGDAVQVNQLLYNLNQRGIEWDLLPWLQQRGIGVMAYSPFDRPALIENAGLVAFASARGITPAQAALAWLLDHDHVIPIPKASHPDRVADNAGALNVALSDDDHEALDRLFPAPTRAQPLQIY